MDQRDYQKIEAYMQECMQDSAHDREHVYRVLRLALDIASYESPVEEEVLVAACLLHDIGREVQRREKKCHAKAGSKMAKKFLRKEMHWPKEKAEHVARCILTHRYRSSREPESLEAQILFDADKIDVTGAMGIARTLMYAGTIDAPLYSQADIQWEMQRQREKEEKGNLQGSLKQGDCKGSHERDKKEKPSHGREDTFFHEYRFKLENLYDSLYTTRGMQLAKERQGHAVHFYEDLLKEILLLYGQRGEFL